MHTSLLNHVFPTCQMSSCQIPSHLKLCAVVPVFWFQYLTLSRVFHFWHFFSLFWTILFHWASLENIDTCGHDFAIFVVVCVCVWLVLCILKSKCLSQLHFYINFFFWDRDCNCTWRSSIWLDCLAKKLQGYPVCLLLHSWIKDIYYNTQLLYV